MGISGLLPALKSITETKALEEYRGQTLAIDGYCWLHRAIYSCSQEICLGQETDKYVNYFIERVDILLRNGITPYVVFDGGPLPMKKGTEVERRAARQKNRELGIQFYKQRNYTEARKYFSRAADVSPFMAHRVIQRLKAKSVRYVVAPYEADAQLAYLTKNGLADGVITEDSDCLPFGCGTVLFKLDKDGVGLAQEIRESNLKKNKGLLFHMFTHEMFLEMCIFSGCDYLPSLPGFGLKKAYTALKQHGSFTKVIRALRLEGKVRIPPTYEAEFEKAVLTFRHQRVFDPRTKQLVPLTPVSDIDKTKNVAMDFLGPMLADDIATAIAEGDMDPITMERFPVTAAPPSSNNNNYAGQSTGGRVNTFNTGALSSASRPSSFQGARQATPAAYQQPRTNVQSHSVTAASLGSRRLPSSFGQRAESSLFASMNTKASSTVSASLSSATTSRSSESSPPVVSRFFAAQPERTSPLDEAEESLNAMPASSSSGFESQDPLDVDVARSISFSPLEEKKQHSHTTTRTENKENYALNASATREPVPPPVKENAFSRMMRAGSLLQKQSLKRKAAASSSTSSRYGKQKPGGMFAHQQQQQQQRPAEQRLQQYARGVSSINQEDFDVTIDHVASSHAESSQYCTAAESEEKRDATEVVESQSISIDSSVVVARGSCLSGVSVSSYVKKVEFAGENNQQSHLASSKPPSTSVLASLDRFRFKK